MALFTGFIRRELGVCRLFETPKILSLLKSFSETPGFADNKS